MHIILYIILIYKKVYLNTAIYVLSTFLKCIYTF